ncbi:universal stress protein [Phormidium sp. CCY1219]|jgi:nucleotide-binding universal stress UspA family protein|uniref:universal stress protein n=1 Tax=Phormidium sp. CCY1219 TaxID=2886104 RepID=UPI002D1EC2AE|nr:universal stress protein [Phormidium sp. CCY1219]MEB3828291.1 universal stress protein [Phormidium sp. CCY1219]
MFKTVLFPLDGTRESREAADTVVKMVKNFNARLVLLSVREVAVEGEEPPPPDRVMSPEAIAELLKNARAMFSQQGIEADTIEREGKPAFVICDVADEMDADLVIMGCRGIGLTEEGLADSVTNRVINLAPCPVLIVP